MTSTTAPATTARWTWQPQHNRWAYTTSTCSAYVTPDGRSDDWHACLEDHRYANVPMSHSMHRMTLAEAFAWADQRVAAL